jgi:hypothetical protein
MNKVLARHFMCILYISTQKLKLSYFKNEEIKTHKSPISIRWKKLSLLDSVCKDGHKQFLPSFVLLLSRREE